MAQHTYRVEIEPIEDGPEPALLERFVTCANRRLAKLEPTEGYPVAGGSFDILDAFEGKFVWEMSEAEFEATPPTRVDFEIVSVDPVEPPAEGDVVTVVARLVQ